MKENWLLTVFFILTYIVSWLFWIPALIIYGQSTLSITNVFQNPIFIVLQTIGAITPSLFAYILIRKYYGKEILTKIIRKYRDYKVKTKWYFISILLFPTITLISIVINKYSINTAFAISSETPIGAILKNYGIIGATISLIVIFFTQIFSSPLFEELGWRGFALPVLQKRYNALISSIIIGIIWAFWHLPLTIVYGNLSFIYYFNFVAYSILMTCLYNNTKGNMLLILLFHASLNVATTYLDFGQPKWIFSLILFLVLLVVIAKFGITNLSKEIRVKFVDLKNNKELKI